MMPQGNHLASNPELADKKIVRRHFLFGLLFAILAIACGRFYYQCQYASTFKTAQESLTSIFDLKVTAIENWMDERRGDTEVMLNSLMVRNDRIIIL